MSTPSDQREKTATDATLLRMHELTHLLRSSRGVFSRAQIADAGISDSELRRLISGGHLWRVRHGWFAASGADEAIIRAVQTGGVLTCVSALRRHGVWVPEGTHRSHTRSIVRRKGPLDAGRCRAHGPRPVVGRAIDDVLCAVRYAANCLDAEGLVVVCDSILNKKMATTADLRSALSHAPVRIRDLIDRCDGRSQSGTESMVRLRLRARNIGVSIQHPIEGVGFVDLLVGKRLVIEADSEAHHTGINNYESDRRRDRTLIRLRYLPLRLTYRQIVHEWPTSEQVIIDLVRRREHLKPPSGSAEMDRPARGDVE